MTSATIHREGADQGATLANSAPVQSKVLYLENQDFNEALDERNDECVINDASYRASEVLYAVDYDAYVEALQLFRQEQAAAYTKVIYDEFPTLIAYPWYRAVRGFENYLQRLHFLRDVWESLIYTLHAVVIGEFCATSTPFPGDKLTKRKLFSESLSDRLDVIEELLAFARQQHPQLAISNLIDQVALSRIRELNRVRNGFSHETAKSEEQARQLYARHHDEVFAVLRSVETLRNYRLLRYMDQSSNLNVRCELFRGHAMTKTFEPIELKMEQLSVWSRYLNRRALVFMCDDRPFTAAPFVHFFDSDTGQYTRLGFFKRKEHGQFVFELVGESRPVFVAESIFDNEVAELDRLLPPSAKGR